MSASLLIFLCAQLRPVEQNINMFGYIADIWQKTKEAEDTWMPSPHALVSLFLHYALATVLMNTRGRITFEKYVRPFYYRTMSQVIRDTLS